VFRIQCNISWARFLSTWYHIGNAFYLGLLYWYIHQHAIIRGSSKGALKLIDFGRSIDMKAFDPCTQFTGSSNTSGFVCTEMKTGKPWSWQVGVAGSYVN